MDYIVLEDLINIEKKSSASNKVKQTYLQEMIKLLDEEDFSENAQKYIKKGFSFCGAQPVAEYISKQEREMDYVMALFTSDFFKENENKLSYRMLLSLLAFAKNGMFKNSEIEIEIIKRIPMMSKEKDGNIFKDATKPFEKYFASQMKETSDYCVEKIELPEKAAKEFVNYLYKMLSQVSPSKTVSEQSIGFIIDWTNKLQEKFIVQSGGESCEIPLQKNKEELGNQHAHRNNEDYSECKKAVVELLDRIDASLIRKDHECKKLLKSKNELKDKNKELLKTLEEKEEVIYGLRESLRARETEIEKFNDVLFEERKAIRLKTQECDQLRGKIEKMNSVMSVYSTDKENSETERLNAIASKLKTQYEDFKSAEGVEMTLDLGENLRDQIDYIFKILKKSGIDVERR